MATELQQPEKPSVRLLAYFNATKPRFQNWAESPTVMLYPLMIGDEYDTITKASKRNKRKTQAEQLRLPLELIVRTFGFVGRKADVGKLLQVCSMFTFLILENEFVKHPGRCAPDGRRRVATRLAKQEYRIVMFGLDGSGKTSLLYKLKLGEVVSTIETVGFNVETLKVKSTSMTLWDVGGADKLRPLWRHYLENLDAMIYVIDAADEGRWHEARDELERLLAHEDVPQSVPVLVYLTKTDKPHCTPEKCCEVLNLDTLFAGRQHCVQPVSLLSGDGLHEGLGWLEHSLRW